MQVSKILGGSDKAEGLAEGCLYARRTIGKLPFAAATCRSRFQGRRETNIRGQNRL